MPGEFYVDNEIINLIIAMTYSVVLFSIVVQGMTIGKLFNKMTESNDPKKEPKLSHEPPASPPEPEPPGQE